MTRNELILKIEALNSEFNNLYSELEAAVTVDSWHRIWDVERSLPALVETLKNEEEWR